MMTSVGVERARGTRDKALPTTTQTTQPQKHLQATAEQIRLAQMIYDKNDADFEDKVKQLMEVTGKNQDDCMVALHDCNEDVNRAINFLLEGTSDATSWETVGKKKSLGKDATSTESKENKENREKKERESSKGRGGSNHKLLYPFELRGKSAILHSPKTLPCLCAGKTPPNLSQGVPPLLPNQYIMGPGGLLPAYPIYGYEDLHMLQSRLPMDYYGITFPGPTATLSGRDGSLASNPYSGDVTKFGRGESTSPAPSTNLSAAHAPQTVQAQSQGQNQHQPQGHHNTQQPFLNPALHPGYSYTGLPYYPGVPGMPSAFQYGPTMFVPPASAKQHGMGLSNPTTPFQQPSGYGQHAFSSGYDDLTQGPAGTEYSKGYSNSSQTQAKSAASGPGKGVSVTSSNSGVPDISGTVYNKTQPFDKQGFHAGTPPPFSLPSALGGTGPLTPGAAPGYAPAPFLHILPAHQQPHSQLLHHHLTQDGQVSPCLFLMPFHKESKC
uniref:Ubiquitin-associated protein 2-like n=1 Tax=Sinocyclocheilus anshuiensis TaxID=1608454 RepID=A0A671ML14_9TELE